MKSKWEKLYIVASSEDPKGATWPQIFSKDLYSFSYSALVLGRISPAKPKALQSQLLPSSMFLLAMWHTPK